MKNLSVDYSSCRYKCEGVDIIGYVEKNDEDRKTIEEIEELSEQYNNYKKVFTFPRKYDSNIPDFFAYSK